MHSNILTASRRGFTIVELAIVLVVIGIILGMAVKGKQLVEAARIKAEVAKLNKFEAAIATNFARKGNVNDLYAADSTVNDTLDHRALIEMGMITEKDRDCPFVVKSATDTTVSKWSFFRCDGNRVCAGVVSCTAATGMPMTDTSHLPEKLLCNVEVIKDDENVTTGEGRAPLGYVTLAEDAFRDCGSVRNKDWDDSGTYLLKNRYNYRVF